MSVRRVCIVGGGVAGLTAAAVAAGAGAEVDLYETVSKPGGRARTRETNGFRFNLGPHALYAGGEAARVLGALGIHPAGARPPINGSLALHGGSLHALPGGPVSLLTTSLLRLPDKLALGRALMRLPRIEASDWDGQSLRAFLEAEIGSPAARAAVEAVVRLTTYANAPEQMSAGAAIRQVVAGLDPGVLYLDGGWQGMVDALAERARQAGARIHTGARGAALRAQAGRTLGLRLQDGSEVDAEAVVLAMGPAEASALVDAGADPWFCEQAETSLPVRAACLDLGLSTLPDPRRRFALGIDEPTYCAVHSDVATGLAPEGGAVVHVARYLAPDEKPDRNGLTREFGDILDLLQPGWRDHVVAQSLAADLRVTHAVPRADRGGLAGRPGPAVPGKSGLYVAGDWVGSRGQLVDASFASGEQAGRAAARAA